MAPPVVVVGLALLLLNATTTTILLTSFSASDDAPAPPQRATIAAYAARHGYVHWVQHRARREPSTLAVPWEKLFLMRDALERGRRGYRAVLWLDEEEEAGALPRPEEVSLDEAWLERFPDRDVFFLLGADDDGAILARTTPWARALFARAVAASVCRALFPRPGCCWAQDCLRALAAEMGEAEWRAHVVVVAR